MIFFGLFKNRDKGSRINASEKGTEVIRLCHAYTDDVFPSSLLNSINVLKLRIEITSLSLLLFSLSSCISLCFLSAMSLINLNNPAEVARVFLDIAQFR